MRLQKCTDRCERGLELSDSDWQNINNKHSLLNSGKKLLVIIPGCGNLRRGRAFVAKCDKRINHTSNNAEEKDVQGSVKSLY